jgi:uncharacterized protein (TIGR01319 family)
LNIEEFNLKDKVKKLSKDIGFVPESDTDFFVDTALACAAAEVATERHAGLIKEITSFHGTVYALFGKDLTEIKTLVGTGGIFVYGKSPERVLETALLNESNPIVLKPKKPKLYIDEKYLIYAVGLLSKVAPTKALRIAKKYLREICS